KAELVGAYRVLDVRPGAPGRARRGDPPMVGRERPLRLLEDAFDSAVADRTSYLFTVLGTAGIGKSRLALEFLNSIDGAARVLRGRCLSYGEGITFWPITEMVTDAAGVVETDGPEEARAKVHALVGALPDGDQVA
ncbi:MAG TPA: AAA family ATPase, partial [Gaiellaceae bacterium]|nr:AAA family ATPase [Gaiellaceae bacterium]